MPMPVCLLQSPWTKSNLAVFVHVTTNIPRLTSKVSECRLNRRLLNPLCRKLRNNLARPNRISVLCLVATLLGINAIVHVTPTAKGRLFLCCPLDPFCQANNLSPGGVSLSLSTSEHHSHIWLTILPISWMLLTITRNVK